MPVRLTVLGHNLAELEDQICRLLVQALIDINVRPISDGVITATAIQRLGTLMSLVDSMKEFEKVDEKEIVQFSAGFDSGLR